jgi:hypothetical protein
MIIQIVLIALLATCICVCYRHIQQLRQMNAKPMSFGMDKQLQKDLDKKLAMELEDIQASL